MSMLTHDATRSGSSYLPWLATTITLAWLASFRITEFSSGCPSIWKLHEVESTCRPFEKVRMMFS